MRKDMMMRILDNYINGHKDTSKEMLVEAIECLFKLYNKEKEKNLIFKGATIVSDLENNGIEMNADKLIALYLEEKEKNKELQNYMKEYLIPKSTINLLYINKDKIREKIKELDKRVIENSEINYFAYLTVGEALSFKHFLEKELMEEE